MTLATVTEIIPFQVDANGVARVGGTRVTLDTVIAALSDGATPEEIAQQYPSLDLADVYYVIGYYLRRPAEVEAYLRMREAQAEGVRKQNESRFDPDGVRDRLLARRPSREQKLCSCCQTNTPSVITPPSTVQRKPASPRQALVPAGRIEHAPPFFSLVLAISPKHKH